MAAVSNDLAKASGRGIAASLAAATFGFGFIGMAAYSLTGPAFGELPTVWQSWGGTVGDSVLPFIVYSLLRGTQLLGPCRVHTLSYVVAMIGSLGGGAAQLAWLADPQPYTNWMLVAPHTFSPVGWYHCGFLVLVSGLVAGTTWELLLRARQATVHASESDAWARRLRFVLGSRATAAALTACLVFTTAVAADAVPSLESLASVGTAASVVAVPTVALLAAVTVLGSTAKLLVRPLTLAVAVTGVVTGLAAVAAIL